MASTIEMDMEEYRKIPIARHSPEARKKYQSDMKRLHGSKLQKGVKVLFTYHGKNVEGIIQKDIGEHDTHVIVRSLNKEGHAYDVKKDLATIYGIGERVEGRTTGVHTGRFEEAGTYTEGPTDMTGKMITHGYSIGGAGGIPANVKHLYPTQFSQMWSWEAGSGMAGLDAPIHHRHLITRPKYQHRHEKWRARVEEGIIPDPNLLSLRLLDEARRKRKGVQRARERIEAGEYYKGVGDPVESRKLRKYKQKYDAPTRGPLIPLNPEFAEFEESGQKWLGRTPEGIRRMAEYKNITYNI